MSDQAYPEPTVGALVINPNDEVLLLRSHKWRGSCAIPGGHVEVGECIEDAVVREVKEETGLDVTELEFICFQECINDKVFWKERHFIFFDFACRTSSSDVTLSDEAQAFEWVPIAEAGDKFSDPYTQRVLREYKKGRRG